MSSKMPPGARETVMARDWWTCQRCQTTTRGLEVHHRKGRGGKDPHRLPNLITLCGPCHVWAHGHPADSYRDGWMVRRIGTVQPEDVVMIRLDGTGLVTPDDGLLELGPIPYSEGTTMWRPDDYPGTDVCDRCGADTSGSALCAECADDYETERAESDE